MNTITEAEKRIMVALSNAAIRGWRLATRHKGRLPAGTRKQLVKQIALSFKEYRRSKEKAKKSKQRTSYRRIR